MNRRERILTAMNRGVPDRPPISFDARVDSPIGEVLRHYGAQDKNDLYVQAGIDGFSVWDWNAIVPRYRWELPVLADGHRPDFWGNSYPTHFGLEDCDTIQALKAHRWPRPEDFDYSHAYRQALAIKAKDQVVSAGHLGLGYQMHNMLRGNIKALYDVTDCAYMSVYLDHLLDFTLQWLDHLLTAARGEIEVVRADDDLGTMDRLMVSPETWRRYYKPCWKAAFDLVHRHGAKIWFHSCGYIRPLLDDLVEIGVDAWNPFPPYVLGNDHEWLREWRRGKMVLDGGVSHHVLVEGTPQQVVETTQRVLDRFAPDGGLLIGPSQVFTADVPAENIIAFFDACLRYGG